MAFSKKHQKCFYPGNLSPTQGNLCKDHNRVEVNKKVTIISVLKQSRFVCVMTNHSSLQKHHRRLSCRRENVCMAINADRSLYAVGSQSHVTFIDARSIKSTNCISAVQRNCGKF